MWVKRTTRQRRKCRQDLLLPRAEIGLELGIQHRVSQVAHFDLPPPLRRARFGVRCIVSVNDCLALSYRLLDLGDRSGEKRSIELRRARVAGVGLGDAPRRRLTNVVMLAPGGLERRQQATRGIKSLILSGLAFCSSNAAMDTTLRALAM